MAICAFGGRPVDLIEIGADRRLHRVDEPPQDAVLVEAVDLFQLRFDARGDLLLLFVARRGCARIEARMEQRDDAAAIADASPASPNVSCE